MSVAPTHVQYNLNEPSYNLHEPGYNFHEPGYNLHEPSVRPSVTLSDFHSVSISGVLCEKLKKADPNYLSILGLGMIF